MPGGVGRRDEGSLVLNSTNVFAALGSLRKKKKSDKLKSKGRSGGATKAAAGKEPEQQAFWAPAPLTAKSWADVEDEDDDDYYATMGPPISAWGSVEPPKVEGSSTPVEESENEEDVDEVDDDVEEDNEPEVEIPVEREPVVEKLAEASLPSKDPERQLSKKELKKKGLEELYAVLAELGYPKKESSEQDESCSLVMEEKKEEKKENASGESKNAKKKKKKDKPSKEAKELPEQPSGKEPRDEPNGTEAGNGVDETEVEKRVDTPAADIKERLKKVASAKKKKTGKDTVSAAKAAANEAALRSAKLAAAKKKEKSHYNQQPVR